MNRFMKTGIKILPWIGMIFLGILYVMTLIGQQVGNHYQNDYKNLLEIKFSEMVHYLEVRAEYNSDKLAFEHLGMIADYQDDRHPVWTATNIGMVKFDSEGTIEKICNSVIIPNESCPSF